MGNTQLYPEKLSMTVRMNLFPFAEGSVMGHATSIWSNSRGCLVFCSDGENSGHIIFPQVQLSHEGVLFHTGLFRFRWTPVNILWFISFHTPSYPKCLSLWCNVSNRTVLTVFSVRAVEMVDGSAFVLMINWFAIMGARLTVWFPI